MQGQFPQLSVCRSSHSYEDEPALTRSIVMLCERQVIEEYTRRWEDIRLEVLEKPAFVLKSEVSA